MTEVRNFVKNCKQKVSKFKLECQTVQNMPYIIVEGDLEAKKEQSSEKFTTAVSGLKGMFAYVVKSAEINLNHFQLKKSMNC